MLFDKSHQRRLKSQMLSSVCVVGREGEVEVVVVYQPRGAGCSVHSVTVAALTSHICLLLQRLSLKFDPSAPFTRVPPVCLSVALETEMWSEQWTPLTSITRVIKHEHPTEKLLL